MSHKVVEAQVACLVLSLTRQAVKIVSAHHDISVLH